MPAKRAAAHGADDDERGLRGARRVHNGVDRRIGAEIYDAPGTRSQRQPKGDQPEIVLLPGRARKHGALAKAAAPTARETEEAATQKARGEVLLRDRGLAAFPTVADVAQVRNDDVTEDRVKRNLRQE